MKQTDSYLYQSLSENIAAMKKMTDGSGDLVIRRIDIGSIPVAVAAAEGMVDAFYFSQIITLALCGKQDFSAKTPQELYHQILSSRVISPDEKTASTFSDAFSFIYSGFGLILVEDVPEAIVFGAQGFPFRSISSPSTDENIKGSKEGFVEALKINQTLIRRRMKTPDLVFQGIRLGKKSRTDCALVYLQSTVSRRLLAQIRDKLEKAELDVVLESGSVKLQFLEKPLSLFTEIGTTERPDTLCAKLYEGKVGLIIDGTPFVLILPFLFPEHFQSLDDYEYKAVYSNFLRMIKYAAFLLSFLLPGLYVALATFHPEILPDVFREKIYEAEGAIAYPFLIEGLIINIGYEIMREAGLRLPKEIGHAVSIVGGLIIGDAAVSAGLVSAPMVLVAAMSAISAFVIPSLMDSLVVLRFMFLLLGGFFGMYGVALGLLYVLVNMCIKTVFGIPYSSGLVPTTSKAFRAMVFKSPRQPYAAQNVPKLQEMPGSKLKDPYFTQEEDAALFFPSLSGFLLKPALSLKALYLFATGALFLCIFALSCAEAFPGHLSCFSLYLSMLLAMILSIGIDLSSSVNCALLLLWGFLLSALIMLLFALHQGTSLLFIADGFMKSLPAKVAAADLLFWLICLPALSPKGRRAYGILILLCLAFCLIMSLLSLPSLVRCQALLLFFLPAFVFIRTCYVLNLCALITSFLRPGLGVKKIKPPLCVALFFFSYGFLTLLF